MLIVNLLAVYPGSRQPRNIEHRNTPRKAFGNAFHHPEFLKAGESEHSALSSPFKERSSTIFFSGSIDGTRSNS